MEITITNALLLMNLALVTTLSSFMAISIIRVLNKIHHAMNSRFDELLDATKVIARAEGVASERDRIARNG